jgi:dihydropteroate synthase
VATPDADMGGPIARVEDAALVDSGGPARLTLSGLPRAREVADRVAAARGVSSWVGERLVVTAVPSRLIDAAGRVGGRELAELLGDAVEPAIDAWIRGAPDLPLSSGFLPTGARPQVVGILNVTPDSFSDGGHHFDPDDHPGAAIAAGRDLLAAGADLLDVGGESTRPGAQPVAVDEELRRVVPVIEALAADGAVLSIDTSKARVAREAVEAGAAIVNDVSAGTLDPELLPTVAELGVPYVLMHMRGTPPTMQQDPSYDDVVGEVYDFLAARLGDLEEHGIPATRVIVDPGIGFGKAAAHNLALLRHLRQFTSLGRPLMIGTSRKSFLGRLAADDDPAARLEGSLVTAALAVAAGARLVRVHDVPETVRAVATAHAVATAGAAGAAG